MMLLGRCLRRLGNVGTSRPVRQLCSASNPNSALKAAATQSWDALIAADWVENEETIPEIAAAESVIDRYRSVYDGTEDELYTQMKDLHEAKEAAKVVELFDEHVDELCKAQETSTGLLGNETNISEESEKSALQAFREYIEFVNVCENDRVARKIEAELGRNVNFLRSQLSIEEFSVHVAPMSVDRIIARR